MGAELKPCPFCGGRAYACAEQCVIKESGKHMWMFYVECDKCGAKTGEHHFAELSFDAWNRRAGDD